MKRDICDPLLRRSRFLVFCLLLGGPVMVGCQSWNAGGFPLDNMSRVPPPGTGTYQLPGGYYNGGTTGQVSSNVDAGFEAATFASANNPAGVSFAGAMPATSLSATAGGYVPMNAVQPAGFAAPANQGSAPAQSFVPQQPSTMVPSSFAPPTMPPAQIPANPQFAPSPSSPRPIPGSNSATGFTDSDFSDPPSLQWQP